MRVTHVGWCKPPACVCTNGWHVALALVAADAKACAPRRCLQDGPIRISGRSPPCTRVASCVCACQCTRTRMNICTYMPWPLPCLLPCARFPSLTPNNTPRQPQPPSSVHTHTHTHSPPPAGPAAKPSWREWWGGQWPFSSHANAQSRWIRHRRWTPQKTRDERSCPVSFLLTGLSPQRVPFREPCPARRAHRAQKLQATGTLQQATYPPPPPPLTTPRF